ncbi:MAG: hypothetical protein IIA61_12075 [Candidatus Marinimicrobia bacterium]|nr:hypothetical protein [Candidatus Neomarinimicrobiota bacterium]
MSKAKVIFGINNSRYQYPYDINQLALGSLVYVGFSPSGEPVSFSPDKARDSYPYYVTWIAPSEWYVSLKDKFIPDKSLQEEIKKLVGDHLSSKDIDKALTIACSDIRPNHMYKSAEFDKSRYAVIVNVVERLDLCSRLSEQNVAIPLFWLYKPLLSG